MSLSPIIELQSVSKSFGATSAIESLFLSIEAGAFCVLVGPSGCGKSTVLRMINAMIAPDLGVVRVRGQNVSELDPIELRRSIGYVIQSVGLFPHWTVAANIATVPRLMGWDKVKIAERVEHIAAALQIDPALLLRYPRQLSGGQQQRVGVARALAADPDILLMDEPFAALDPVSRGALQGELRRLHKESGKTIVFVTHDMNEALRLATHIIVMDKGRVIQAGAPADILLRPRDAFVEGFLGREDLPLRLLDLATVGERTRPATTAAGSADEPIAIRDTASLRQALTLMLERHRDRLAVENERGELMGEIAVADVLGAGDAG
ncbi:ABC transporter ATP-binding protein [Methylocella tundrae]|uniref:Putative transporter subunit: ATP-binding component of ABC superfamily transporter n=1 Tax=Methylocella tundrae TaxID=227605 RepID=A0A4U8Z4Z0_METTU|nr:ABC transporter ATP-binding protein [Methylocella tundrae]WPP04263.1 ABC transporter ATP-binding protein [Methylocella tundrae]VFU10582.1 putative transporter subunit: ATP-binding component of ABC superfamily transporter [Methylocella tundrae]